MKLKFEMLRQSPDSEELWSEADLVCSEAWRKCGRFPICSIHPRWTRQGLLRRLAGIVEGFAQRSGVTVRLDVPDDLGRFPDAVELALFRVLQEALTNVHRHSGASEAHGRDSEEDGGQVVLDIKDNGRGIPEDLLGDFHATGAGMGVGLAGIRERAWELGGRIGSGIRY